MTVLVWLVVLASQQRGVLTKTDLMKVFYARRTWGRPPSEPIWWMQGGDDG